MAPFEYIVVLVSIVLGLVMARLLTGIGELVLVRGGAHLYRVHLVWSLNVLVYTVLVWWTTYRWRGIEEWSFFLALFVLLPPTGLYLLSVILFPGAEPSAGMREHFHVHRRSFFMLLLVLQAVDITDTLLKGWAHFEAQGTIYLCSHLLYAVFNLVAIITAREGFHRFYAVFFLAYLLLWISISARLLA